MIKIIMSLFCCLFFQQTVPMKKDNFTVIPLDEQSERMQIGSYEGLRLLATGLQGEWDTVATRYDVQPRALAEYVACVERKETMVDTDSLSIFKRLYKNDSETYAKVVEYIMDEICQQDLGKSGGVLSQVRQRFQSHVAEKERELDAEIIKIKSEYSAKRCRYIWHLTSNATAGVVLVTGLSLISLFGWVIAHCHHPWD